MKVVVIGASGHVGAYLVDELHARGHEVYAVMRGNRRPLGCSEIAWQTAEKVYMTREELYESDVFTKINPDVVCDLIAYDVDGVKKVLQQIPPRVFYVQIGSIWTYEDKRYVPVDENHPKNSTEEYGKQKGLIEDYLLDLAKNGKRKTTVVHPGHVSAKEWQPINPQGNLDLSVFEKLKNGEEVVLPYLGLPTLQHVHSRDLARVIATAAENPDLSNGQAFISVAEKAVTLRALCEHVAARYGKKANLRYVEWEEFARIVGKQNADCTLDHVAHSPCCTPEKAKRVLGVTHEYSIFDIFDEYLDAQR